MLEHQSVVGIVFSICKKEVLLIKRRDVPVWVLPGGGLERNETPEEGTLREVLEETGLTTTIVRKVGEYTPLNRLAHFTHVYECALKKGALQTSSETKEVRFFSITSLPKLLPPPYNEWIQEGLNSKVLVQRSLNSVNYFNFCKFLLTHPILVGRFLLQKMGIPFNS